MIMQFFMWSYHIQDASAELILQVTLSTANSGMGLLSLQQMAPAAYIASLRDMLTELLTWHRNAIDVNSTLQGWSYEQQAKQNWENYHNLVDQMLQIGTNTEWSHEAFLALPIQETQHKLQRCYSNAL